MSDIQAGSPRFRASFSIDRKRALHWVLKVGDLQKSVEFLSKVFGMRVLRHEEFESGCEATCNGPYAGAWSKTMVGYGPERTNFALELTANYGVHSYEKGNDLRHIGIRCITTPSSPWIPFSKKHMVEQAKKLGYAVDEELGMITGPDGYKFRLVDAEEKDVVGRDPFCEVSLNVTNLEFTLAYWRDLLKMRAPSVNSDLGVTDTKVTQGRPSARLVWGADVVALEFVQLPEEEKLEHAAAFGRIAFSTEEGPKQMFDRITIAKEDNMRYTGSIINEPITLRTPGKADVVVTILADPDGYEICFVNEDGFNDLSTLKPGLDFINWGERAAREAKMESWAARKK
eukprot:GDKI01015585.1.p1 GENE.GDKI01015585.1~~GDKI01015585.1.p1  ORF type:complete len:343 (-),score=66.28 GDKI01015585.1:383-1411(-)